MSHGLKTAIEKRSEVNKKVIDIPFRKPVIEKGKGICKQECRQDNSEHHASCIMSEASEHAPDRRPLNEW